ncbi:MAG: TIGR04024 family LLM class F420-dependent oxidoreductase [Halobacteriales archaeon]
MTRDVTLPVASQPALDDYADLAGRAEALGYDRVWLPETWGRDAVTVLAAIAERTTSVGLGASILPVYSRTPALVGQTAATLQELAEGRFRLGVGPSGPVVVEGWHGVGYDRPLRRTREAIEVVKAVVRGEEVDYRGELFDLAGFRLRFDPPTPAPPVDAAGMGPKAVELAGRFADGWHALMFTPDGLRERLGDFRRGVELGGRDRSAQRVTLAVPCCALEDGDRARRLVRAHLAFYVGGMGTYYREALARQGHEELANDVAAKWGSGDREAAAAAIPGDLLDSLGAAGTPEQAREQLARFGSLDGVDAVSVSFPRGADPDDMAATLEALAP